MSRPERVGQVLRQIERETQVAFDEHTELFNLNNQLKAENAKLRKYAKLMHDHINECCNACGERCICDIDALTRELGAEAPDD